MIDMDRKIDKVNYYLDIAQAVSQRGTCLRRNYGAIIVKNDEIIATGYTGAPRGEKHCTEIGTCFRIQNKIPSGQQYEACRSVHAEMNAIISAARKDMIDSTLYLVGTESDTGEYVKDTKPCSICSRLITNAGISKIVTRVNKNHFNTLDLKSGSHINQAGIKVNTIKIPAPSNNSFGVKIVPKNIY